MSIADKLLTVSKNVSKVFDAGKKTEYDRFWDAYQNGGNRTIYRFGFGGAGWNDDNFRPKYDIMIGDGYMMFAYTNITDVAQILEDAGVTMSQSAISNAQYLFWNAAKLIRVPVIRLVGGLGSASTAYGIFDSCTKLKTIDKIVLENGLQNGTYWSYAFNNCRALENIVFEGVIGSNISFSVSPLSKESIESIVNALSDTTSDCTVTLNETAVNNAFTEEEWAALVAAKPNWTISLV